MKTFINAARVSVIALLFVSLTALGECCNRERCAPKPACTPGCKLMPEPVKIIKTCDNPGFYKQVCHLEYVPCEGVKTEVEAYPKFMGCYDEAGNRIDGNANGSMTYSNGGHTAYTNDVRVEAIAAGPYGYDVVNGGQTTKQTTTKKATRNSKRAKKVMAQ